MTFWQAFALILLVTVSLFAAFTLGFHFGWLSRRGTPPPPVRVPSVSELLESVVPPKKDEGKPVGFYE